MKTIIEKLDKLNEEKNLKFSEIREEYFKYLDSHKIIKELTALQDSKPDGYMLNEFGDVESWKRIALDFSDFEDERLESLLNEYLLENYFFHVDFKNNCLIQNQGPEEIIINDEGDVFCGSKCIISKNNYENKTDLYQQIENYMEKTGYYPGVFYCDRYGELTLVNTRSNQ